MGKNDRFDVNAQQGAKGYESMNKAEKERFKQKLIEEKKRKGEAVPWWVDDDDEKVTPKVEEPTPVQTVEPVPEPVEEAAEEVKEVREDKEIKEEPTPVKKTAVKKSPVRKKAPAKKASSKKKEEIPQQTVTVAAVAQGATGYGQYCKYCGRLIPWDSNFCPACGKKLEPAVKTVEESKGVKFAEEDRKTFDEQLSALKKKDRALYDDLIKYALAKDDARESVAKYAVTVIVGRFKLIQILFQRGKLVARFMTASSDFKKYSAQEKAVKIKERPTVVEIDSEESVTAAKNLIDITYNNIQEARGKTID